MELIDRALLEMPSDENNWEELVKFADDVASADTVQAIPIPKGATNGDIIKAMFPHSLFEEHTDSDGYTWMIMWNGIDYQCDFDIDWWNSPYKENKDGNG